MLQSWQLRLLGQLLVGVAEAEGVAEGGAAAAAAATVLVQLQMSPALAVLLSPAWLCLIRHPLQQEDLRVPAPPTHSLQEPLLQGLQLSWQAAVCLLSPGLLLGPNNLLQREEEVEGAGGARVEAAEALLAGAAHWHTAAALQRPQQQRHQQHQRRGPAKLHERPAAGAGVAEAAVEDGVAEGRLGVLQQELQHPQQGLLMQQHRLRVLAAARVMLRPLAVTVVVVSGQCHPGLPLACCQMPWTLLQSCLSLPVNLVTSQACS